MKAKLQGADIVLTITPNEADRITRLSLRETIRLNEYELAHPVIHPEDHIEAEKTIAAAKYLLEYYGDSYD